MLAAASIMVATAPFAPQHVDVEAYSETITVIADLDGGVFAQIHLSISNLGIGDNHAACRILLVDAAGTWTATQYYSQEDWRYRDEAIPRLEIDECFIADERPVRVRARVKGGTVSLQLDAKMSSTRPPGHRLEIGDRFFEQQVLVPWAEVRAWIDVPGRPARELRGRGTVDHFRVTAYPPDIADVFVRVYGLGDQRAVLVQGRLHASDQPASGWLWDWHRSAPQRVAAIHIMDVAEGAASGGVTRVKKQLNILTADGSYRVKLGAQLYRYAPLEELGILGYLASKLLGNPVTRTYRAWLTGGGAAAAIPTIVEISQQE